LKKKTMSLGLRSRFLNVKPLNSNSGSGKLKELQDKIIINNELIPKQTFESQTLRNCN